MKQTALADTERTGAETIARTSSLRYHGSGSKDLDVLLGGGYKEGKVVEFFGRSNSGKTQLAMQAALVAARSGFRSLFVDTEGSFRPERLEGMAIARGWEPEKLLDRIVYLRTDSSSEQMEIVRGMSDRQATASCRLVLVDTLTRNFSIEMPGRASMATRQGALNVYLSEIAREAYLNARAYVLTNRVTYGTGHDIGIGGATVDQLVHSQVRLDRIGDKIKFTLLPGEESLLAQLGKNGIL